jgi:hypothetical protein
MSIDCDAHLLMPNVQSSGTRDQKR